VDAGYGGEVVVGSSLGSGPGLPANELKWVLSKSGKSGKFSRMVIILRTMAMNLRENGKRIYSRWKAFVSRHFLAALFVTLMLLQPVIWLVARSLENTSRFYRCSSHDYPCGVVAQPEPRL
jgi:hypothetical protein